MPHKPLGPCRLELRYLAALSCSVETRCFRLPAKWYKPAIRIWKVDLSMESRPGGACLMSSSLELPSAKTDETCTCRPRPSSESQHPIPATIITYTDLSNNPSLVCLFEASKPPRYTSPRHCSSARWTTGSHPPIPAPLQTSAGQLGQLMPGTVQMLHGASDSASWPRCRSTPL